MKYSLKRKAENVTVESEDGGGTEEFEIREMSAAVRDQYLNRLGKRLRLGPDGSGQGVKNFDGLQSDLISCCLFRATGGEVPEKEIQAWPATLVSELFKLAQSLNKLDKEHEEAEGKD